MDKKFNLFFYTMRILLALKMKYEARDSWKYHATKTIILPIRIEAPSKTIWGKVRQRIRKAVGRVYCPSGEMICPSRLGKAATEIFDSFCSPATYNIVPTEGTRIEAHYRQTEEGGYICRLTVRHEKRTICRVRLNLSVSDGEARIEVFAPLALLARLIATGTAHPARYGHHCL